MAQKKKNKRRRRQFQQKVILSILLVIIIGLIGVLGYQMQKNEKKQTDGNASASSSVSSSSLVGDSSEPISDSSPEEEITPTPEPVQQISSDGLNSQHALLVRESDLAEMMNLGGDDFIAKPFDLNVLTAKLQAVLRRAYDFTPEIPALEHRGALLLPAEAVLTYRGERINLTKNELRILQTLLEQKGRVVGRDALMQRLWETDSFIDDNTLTVNIARLRRKLDAAGLSDFIVTKVGMGYVVG